MCHLPVPKTRSHATVPSSGLERCGDKYRPEQKPKARNEFPDQQDPECWCSLWSVVGSRVGSQVDLSSWALDTQCREGTDTQSVSSSLLDTDFCGKHFAGFLLGLLFSVLALPHYCSMLSELLTEGEVSVFERDSTGDGASCPPWDLLLWESCLHL